MSENESKAAQLPVLRFPAQERNEVVTVALTQEEHAAAVRMAEAADMSLDALMRHALRHYSFVRSRIEAGETMSFSGDRARAALFRGGDLSPEEADMVAARNFALL